MLDGGLWVKTEITELRCVMLFIAEIILNIAELRFAISMNGQAVG
ncbi:hypothetical protein B2K_40375 [Paenibacillus mucilaginosus K02]|uniref:Uncharacterized protein n=1 Tax=Paenibacillus mucilaginosus K02 TaxID=997761 RepID=R9ULV3_9BACL|nr:hypothetical protein B2K_40375 [Paenibacillus mucilaginosus K02]